MNQPHKQIRVLHLTDYGAPYEGNFVASLRALEHRLNAHGEVMFYVFPRRSGSVVWTQNMMKEKENVLLIKNDGFIAYMLQVRRLLIENNITVLHEHFIHYQQKFAALIACLICGHRVKTVLHLHNHIELPSSPLRRLPHLLQFSSVSRFVCCSKSVADHLIADRVSPDRVAIAENAIAFNRLDAFDPDMRQSLHLNDSTKVALMFGYNFEVKGVDLALEAMRLLRERTGMDAVLAVVLSSRRDDVQAKICAQLGVKTLPEWVRLFPPREEVGSYYRMADVFLSPSRQEGFCYALVEAAYCLTPVLASAIDAQKDLALPQDAFFPSQDSVALSNAIEKVFSEPASSKRIDMLTAAKKRVVETYSLACWAETVAGVYEEIV